MQPYKRASLIAKSIVKMIEASDGGSVEISMTTILLPATIFDDLLRDCPSPATDGAERVRINGIYFERVSSRRRRKRRFLRLSSVAKTHSAAS